MSAGRSSVIAFPVLALLVMAGCGTVRKSPAPDSIRLDSAIPSSSSLAQGSAPNTLRPEAALRLVQGERDKYWLNAKKEVYRSVPELVGQHQAELLKGLALGKLMHGDRTRKELAITFDDGPHPQYTPAILAILRQYNVKATFFVVGEQAEKHPDLIRDEIAGGHNVGNHTYDHVSLVKIPEDYVATEIKACGEVLRQITGKAPHLFRPPGGDYNQQVADTSEALGYRMVLWTDDPGDYASPGAELIVTRTLRTAGNGGILLLHDGIQQTLDVLPRIIAALQKKGFRFVTIDEMISESGQPVHRRP